MERRGKLLGLLMHCAAVMVLCATVLRPAFVDADVGPGQASFGVAQPAAATVSDAPWGREVHHVSTRADRAMRRFLSLVSDVGMLWLWLALSAIAFLVVAAVASVVDMRMWQLRRESPGAASRYFGRGIRTFFRILRDRHTPSGARALLALALVYWLVPFDLVPDSSVLPGFADDLVVAVSAAKGFMYLCPDSLVAWHAAAVESHAQRVAKGTAAR